jgi:hypothetical protein
VLIQAKGRATNTRKHAPRQRLRANLKNHALALLGKTLLGKNGSPERRFLRLGEDEYTAVLKPPVGVALLSNDPQRHCRCAKSAPRIFSHSACSFYHHRSGLRYFPYVLL